MEKNNIYEIGFDQAWSITMQEIRPLGNELISIFDAVYRVAFQDVHSKISAPSVDSSLKDGYALVSRDIKNASRLHPVTLKIIGSIEAGSKKKFMVTSGQVVRILTGAPIPEGADAVLSEEFAISEGDELKAIADAEKGRNIMWEGTDVKQGALLVEKGAEITPSKISLLVAGGITHLEVYKKPTIGLLATGDEILLPGSEFRKGKLFASNMALQQAWLKSFGFDSVFTISADSMQALSSKLTALMSQSDAIITSGGAWKGDRDLIAKVLDQLGWKKMFHRIRMGPGKAVGFGTLQGKPIFCLPGGPPSNEMAFLMIAFPAVYQMAGYGHSPYIRMTGILESKVQGKATWTQFIHCTIQESGKTFLIRPLKLESRLASMAGAQGILKIPEGVSEIEAGREISIALLDNSVIKSRDIDARH